MLDNVHFHVTCPINFDLIWCYLIPHDYYSFIIYVLHIIDAKKFVDRELYANFPFSALILISSIAKCVLMTNTPKDKWFCKLS